jgi:hypothetical protein
MQTIARDINLFREPLGFVDLLALLTLAGSVCTTSVLLLTALGRLLS